MAFIVACCDLVIGEAMAIVIIVDGLYESCVVESSAVIGCCLAIGMSGSDITGACVGKCGEATTDSYSCIMNLWTRVVGDAIVYL